MTLCGSRFRPRIQCMLVFIDRGSSFLLASSATAALANVPTSISLRIKPIQYTTLGKGFQESISSHGSFFAFSAARSISITATTVTAPDANTVPTSSIIAYKSSSNGKNSTAIRLATLVHATDTKSIAAGSAAAHIAESFIERSLLSKAIAILQPTNNRSIENNKMINLRPIPRISSER